MPNIQNKHQTRDGESLEGWGGGRIQNIQTFTCPTRFSDHAPSLQCTEVRFASFFSGGFINAIAVNPPERRLAERTGQKQKYYDILNPNWYEGGHFTSPVLLESEFIS